MEGNDRDSRSGWEVIGWAWGAGVRTMPVDDEVPSNPVQHIGHLHFLLDTNSTTWQVQVDVEMRTETAMPGQRLEMKIRPRRTCHGKHDHENVITQNQRRPDIPK